MSYHETECTETEEITKIDCEITRADLKKMIELNDSGMCDLTTQNAAALALKRKLKPHHSVTIHRAGHPPSYICEVDGKQIGLSSDLVDLFESIDHGLAVAGYHFQAAVPVNLLVTAPQNVEFDEQPLHSKGRLQNR